MIRLSICIPTYNFGGFIGETLDSILPNIVDGVEVVILDGGSTDNTAEVVAQRARNRTDIHYHRQDVRGGIDRDIATVVSLAQGEYCWLFSADDIMKSGAVNKILNSISSKYDIYMCEQTLCTLKMDPIKEHPIFNGISTVTLFDLGKPEDRLKYFKKARTSEAFFSFLSGPIFRRELWNSLEDIPDSFYDTCWALAGRLLSSVKSGLKIYYLSENLLFKRGENDSFLERGVVNRLRISVDGFTHIAETIFGKDSTETYHIRRVIRNERTLFHLLILKKIVIESCNKEDIKELHEIVSRHYSNAGCINSLKFIIFRIAPLFISKLGELLKKTLIKFHIICQIILAVMLNADVFVG